MKFKKMPSIFYSFQSVFYVFIFLISNFYNVLCADNAGCVTDTIFVMDSSGSIRHSFEQYRQYVKELIEQMPIAPDGNHAALMVYSGRLRQFTKFALDQQPQSREKLLKKVKALPHLNGVTATGVALDVVTSRELPKRRMSPTTRTNVVLLTDGFSYDSIDVQSDHLHSISDVRTFSVCLDKIRVHEELVKFAGSTENVFIGQDSKDELLNKLLDCPAPPTTTTVATPTEQIEVQPAAADVPAGSGEEAAYAYGGGGGGGGGGTSAGINETAGGSSGPETYENRPNPAGGADGTGNGTNAGNKKAGKEIQNDDVRRPSEVAETKAPQTTTTPEPKVCPTDFIFVLDGSGSLRKRFEHQKAMASELIEELPQGQGMRIGIVKYSGKGRSRVKLPIDNHLSRAGIQKLINDEPFYGGTTFTNEALKMAMGELEKRKNGKTDRKQKDAMSKEQRQQIVIVFTDGMSQEDPTAGARALHGKGAIVYSIAVEDGLPVNMRELELIAGAAGRVFTDKNFDKLKEQMRGFAKNC